MEHKIPAYFKKNPISDLKSTKICSYRDPSSISKSSKPEQQVKLKPVCGCTASSEQMRIRATTAEAFT